MDTSKLQLYFFFILFISVGAIVFFIFQPFMQVLLFAGVFAVVFQPLYKKILMIYRGRETFAALSVMGIIALFVIIPVSFLMTQLVNESETLYFSLVMRDVNYINVITDFIEMPIQKIYPAFSLDVVTYADQLFSWMVNNIGSLISGTAKTVLNFFLVAVSFFVLLKDGSRFKQALLKLSPLKDTYNKELMEKLESSIRAVLKGRLLIAIIQGVIAGVGFFIFGVPNATLWGSLTILAALIPGLGTGLVTFPAVAYLFFVQGNTVSAIGLGLWGMTMVGMIDNVLVSVLYGRDGHVHPLIIFFSVLGGLLFFGPAGLIFGPIVVSLFFALVQLYTVFIIDARQKDTI